jgi:hypothetical protein
VYTYIEYKEWIDIIKKYNFDGREFFEDGGMDNKMWFNDDDLK